MKRSEVTHTLLSFYHHGISLTCYRWSPVCLSICLSIKPDYPWGPAAKSQLLQVFVLWARTHTHRHEWPAGRVSAQVVTLHIKLWRLLWLYTPQQRSLCACVCVWKVNTVSSSAAVWTLSLFSSQRSVWKAYCCANHGVTERAVPPQPTPAPLLNLRVWTVICTMVCTAQTLPVSGTSFFVVCCVKQLQNAVQKVNGSQWQKARTAAV